MIWTINDRMEHENQNILILAPSAITLIIFFAIPAVLEIWWFFIVLDLYIGLLCTTNTNIRTECYVVTAVVDIDEN